MSQPFQPRPAQPDDIPFIYASWLKSYRADSHVGASVPKGLFFDHYKLVLDRILLDGKALVMSPVGEPSTILGYLVYEPGIVHYAFVKEHWRRLGIAKQLYRAAFGDHVPVASHRTRHTSFLRVPYNPFVLYRGVTCQEK